AGNGLLDRPGQLEHLPPGPQLDEARRCSLGYLGSRHLHFTLVDDGPPALSRHGSYIGGSDRTSFTEFAFSFKWQAPCFGLGGRLVALAECAAGTAEPPHHSDRSEKT